MPLQKGKKKTKRERRRFGALGYELAESEQQPVEKSPRRPAQPVRRTRRQLPLWANLSVGITMVLFGVIWDVTAGSGTGAGERFLLLGAYCLVAGVYLVKAWQQYRAKRGL